MVNPSSPADCVAQAIASAEISIPVRRICGVAQCRPKPPTPQNRSHIWFTGSRPTQSRAVAYSWLATVGLVWKKLFGRIHSGTSLKRSASACAGVKKISSSPSMIAICTG
ncbi:hypothetical protein D3C78_1616100 [compost metagenome]